MLLRKSSRHTGESLEEPLPTLLNGDDLIALGFVQGPSIGECLDDIREKQIAGEMTDSEQARIYAKVFLDKIKQKQ